MPLLTARPKAVSPEGTDSALLPSLLWHVNVHEGQTMLTRVTSKKFNKGKK
jgi:hypothetical protein